MRTVVVAALALAAVLALAPSAGAVLPGFNGRIVFVSGRGGPANDDSEAKIYLRTITSDTGAGSASGTVTPTAGIQHRHPTWSPDRTKIAYAAGVGGNYDIYVLDLTTPGAVPQNFTNSNNVTDDRPAWSPDGEHIAYESEVADGSNQTDVLVKAYPPSGLSPLFITSTNGVFEGKPAWSPDSQTIYFARGPLSASDILKKASNGAGSEQPVLNLADSVFQPSISPDGTKMCYTRGTGFNGTAEIWVTNVSTTPAAEGFDLSDTPTADPNMGALASYNCTWSPDGELIAYVEGQTTQGTLLAEPSDDSSGPLPPIEATANHFDGNPDWAPDGTPVCKGKTVSTPAGKPLQITIDCDDTGPAYEQTAVSEKISDPPDHGKLGPVTEGDPSTVTYTPNKNFGGTDSFMFNGIDAVQFATPAKVTIKVDDKPPVLSNLEVDPSAWKRSSGTEISFNLSEKANVTLTFQRARPGRRVGGKCVKPTPANKNKPKCTRYVGVGKKTVAGKKGKNKINFKGRISPTKVLSPGRYKLKARAKDGAGNQSATKTAKFRILKP